MVRKGIVLSLIIILGYCVYLYIESTAFYDLRPYFYKNIEIYEKMVDARVNTPNDEKQLSVLEKKLRTKAKVEYVFSRLVQNEVSGEYERIEDIDFTRANQSIYTAPLCQDKFMSIS